MKLLRLVERQKSEEEIRLKALREAAAVGIADISAGRYRTFDTRDTLRDHLLDISEEELSNQTSQDDTAK